MKQIIISIVGALLILQVIRLVLPEGAVKKYASFIVCALVMLILTASIAGSGLAFFNPVKEPEKIPETTNIASVQNDQIMRNFSSQLNTDMKKSIPELQNADLSFTFNIDQNNTGYVTSMTIKSDKPKNSDVISRISSLYMIDSNVIEWRTQ